MMPNQSFKPILGVGVVVGLFFALLLLFPASRHWLLTQQTPTMQERQLAHTRFLEWVAWRGKHCRFGGLMDNQGRWVCDNGENYPGGIDTDENRTYLYPLPTKATIPLASIQVKTFPVLYRSFTPTFQTPPPHALVTQKPTLKEKQFQAWVIWRSSHCIFKGLLDLERSGYFACDDGQSYPAIIEETGSGRGGYYTYEAHQSPSSWTPHF